MIDLIPENYQPVFGSIIVMIGIFGTASLFISRLGRKNNQLIRKFQDAEREANMADNIPLPKEWIKKIDIFNLYLDKIDCTNLDASVIEKIERFKSNILIMNEKEFVYPRQDTPNIEIKQLYGPIYLQKYIALEQNYNVYAQKLIDFSDVLYENNLYNEAIQIINVLIDLKCTSSKPYITLKEIYIKQNKVDKITELKTFIENADFFPSDNFSKNRILSNFSE